jgi:long-chain acyl-CoA synthetase
LSVELIFDTLPKLLLRNAERYAGQAAMRHKVLGIWQTWTWSRLKEEVCDLSAGLTALGVARDDVVAVIGDNRPHFYAGMIAVQCLGAIPMPLNPDCHSKEVLDLLKRSQARAAIVQDQEQVDKILSFLDRLPDLRLIIFESPRGLENYNLLNLLSLIDVQRIGRDAFPSGAQREAAWLEAVGKGSGVDPCVILHTAGTSSAPKAVRLTHQDVIRSAESCNACDKLSSSDVLFAQLPIAWADDFATSVGQAFAAAMCICCPEHLETASENRREIAPTIFFAPPRLLQGIVANIMDRMSSAGNLKSRLFIYFLRVSRHCEITKRSGRGLGIMDCLRYWIGDLLVYGPLRDQIGLSKSRAVYAVGAAIAPDVFSFYRGIGINLKQRYGHTEAGNCLTVQSDDEAYPDTVGKSLRDVQIRIADSGEVEYRRCGAFDHYDGVQTGAAPSSAKWIGTGDIGSIDAKGHLRILDRASDIGKLRCGTLFSPNDLEQRARAIPEVREAIALGKDRSYVTMILDIDVPTVISWCKRNEVEVENPQEIALSVTVLKKLRDSLHELNSGLSESLRVKRFAILPKRLDADDGEMTRTLKVRRSVVYERYTTLIEALYSNSTECSLSIPVSMEGAQEEILESKIKIIDLVEAA